MDQVKARAEAPSSGPAMLLDSCDRCRGPFQGGHYTITMAYRPTPTATPAEPSNSSATFHLCRPCATDLVHWIARPDRR